MMLVWFGQKYIGLIPGLALAFWFLTNLAGFYILLPAENSSKEKFALASSFSLLFIYSIFQLIPNIEKTFFWYSAFRTHSLAVVLFNVYLVFYLYYRKYTNISRWLLVIALLLSPFNGGFSESFTSPGYYVWLS